MPKKQFCVKVDEKLYQDVCQLVLGDTKISLKPAQIFEFLMKHYILTVERTNLFREEKEVLKTTKRKVKTR